ncbi:unnamed protein product [Mytilus edulis]|uniref:Uncharacterized protein n=1 Tax=Mytilus edulis TaxID=6550 RepID=A0A8S3QWS4_MYTED|nr:unnamed protein product [Mytilus edulis]
MTETEIRLGEPERILQLMKTEIEEKERKINRLNTKLSEFTRTNKELRTRIETDGKKINTLQRKTNRIEKERDELQLKIDSWFAQKNSTVKVQMYAAVKKELCDKMMTELEGMLRTQLALKHTPINVEKHKEPPPDSTVPLIAMCVNASRLGSDVNYAIDNIDRSRTIAVVVLHHKEYHALPKQPSERLLIGSDYKHIGAIIDIAYLTHKGIYPCDMNENSLDRLVNFITTNS